MKTRSTHACTHLAATLALVIAPALGQAESSFVSTASGSSLSTSARLDFQVTIPAVLFLQVGSGPATGFTNNANVSLIEFSVPADRLGDGTAVDATPTSGDQNGRVSVRLRGNTGDMQLSVATTGALRRAGSTETIPWSAISVSDAATSALASVAHPGWDTTNTIPATNAVVDLQALWTFRYSNPNVIRAGQYGGINANNGRVTYTATQP